MNEELNLEIGTKEEEKLHPATVEIIDVEVKKVGEKQNKKIVCMCKHPMKEELIEISSVKYIAPKSNRIKTTGLWLNVDDEGKIVKGSVLANFLSFLELKCPIQLKGKSIDTDTDDNGFLCFKAF